MEKRKISNNCSNARGRINRGGMEANILAILDSAESHKDSQDAKDDRIDFLEAVRTASFVPENGTPPTEKMVEAVFQILREGKSLELIMSSYELLNEIEKSFPRVYISESSGNGSRDLIVINEAWSPLMVSLDVMSSEREATQKNFCGLFDPNGFHELVQGLAELANETISKGLDTKSLGNMLLFQYLVNVLEGDFVPRINVYKESMKWSFLKECLLNMLLGSRRINYKVLMKDCLSTICGLCQDYAGIDESGCSETSMEKSSENHNNDVTIALLEVQKTTCMAMQKLLIMIMELDISKKQADMKGQTTRADGVRTPLVEIILDELTYDRDILSPFLQVFNDPKWKLELIVQYFLKYTAKPSVRTRRSNSHSEDSTFVGVLKSFSNSSSTKNIIKKIDVEVVQLLLAHAFQAYLSMSSQQHLPGLSNCKEAEIDSSLMEISKNVIAAFNSLRGADKSIEISSLGKEALFTAAMIIQTTS
ncbi:negative regulator of systemic acquired resistance SNI1 isoform X2 [Durio zibethinus]|uniref:Negative regulator of systemic acquired resistance SNI1 isoform X2 n=1 Tax=Durio zibethinus TaxID=66656 RepID=A0A6P5WIN1_DURZI|nr:negative regulator of systemic acquired resistance SNI1 isoform X2 [Durio zibethinus]XP_022715803.1 negative regulator of systemic acquired resistance SNI1 isoform X2 [Durio zibethinus]XP_022715804.1 negative regulator of systemic acquired resistance SNI1 isoform X2 [Durio zibethinus]XP_022715806.1 negative regulator of systemic acquired resistance SNI1 isoform X2 [Durio zibethinus]